MSGLARVTEVEHLGEHRLRLTFTDGLVRELDFSDAAREWAGVLGPLRDPTFFARVAVDSRAGTMFTSTGVVYEGPGAGVVMA